VAQGLLLCHYGEQSLNCAVQTMAHG